MPQYNQSAHHSSRRSTFGPAFWLLLGVSSALVILALAARAEAAILETEALLIQAEVTAPNKTARRLDLTQLQADINQLIEGQPDARVSVALHDFVTDKTLLFGSEESFVAASVPKLLTASLWLHEVDEGRRSLGEPVGGTPAEDLLSRLIEVSDNTAWEVLDAELGRVALENYARQIGMTNYDFAANSLSARDTLVLLQKLHNGTLLKPDSQARLEEYMAKANYRQYIIAGLPDDVTAYHKVGYLEDRVLDAAIVESGQLSYGLVVFTEAAGAGFDLASAGQLVRDITELVQSRY